MTCSIGHRYASAELISGTRSWASANEMSGVCEASILSSFATRNSIGRNSTAALFSAYPADLRQRQFSSKPRCDSSTQMVPTDEQEPFWFEDSRRKHFWLFLIGRRCVDFAA